MNDIADELFSEIASVVTRLGAHHPLIRKALGIFFCESCKQDSMEIDGDCPWCDLPLVLRMTRQELERRVRVAMDLVRVCHQRLDVLEGKRPMVTL